MRAADRLSLDRLAAVLGPLAGRRLWIGYSGGLDSLVLLHASARLRERLRLRLSAVHIHHGLQPAADSWASHCAAVCRAMDVPLIVRRLELLPAAGESLEAQAREARYTAFRALLTPGDTLATAHHRDDQAETLLLALLRGAGPHGLAAMPARAALGNGELFRPLLDLPRAALLDYAREQRLHWIDDPSNADEALDRARLRIGALPLLRERWPALDRTLARSAAHCAEAATLLDGLADELLAGLAADTPDALSITRLVALEGARQRLVLRRWLTRQGFLPPDQTHLQRIIDEVLGAAPDRQPLVSWRGCEVRRHRDALLAMSPLPPLPPDDPIRASGGRVALPAPLGVLSWSLRAGAEALGLRVAFGARGLRCARAGRPQADLKSLFQEAGIPAWLRRRVPLLLGDGHLLGVAGVAICDPRLTALRWQGHPWEQRGWFALQVGGAERAAAKIYAPRRA
jgi:tRNA(Ile)-lysidine synthase